MLLFFRYLQKALLDFVTFRYEPTTLSKIFKKLTLRFRLLVSFCWYWTTFQDFPLPNRLLMIPMLLWSLTQVTEALRSSKHWTMNDNKTKLAVLTFKSHLSPFWLTMNWDKTIESSGTAGYSLASFKITKGMTEVELRKGNERVKVPSHKLFVFQQLFPHSASITNTSQHYAQFWHVTLITFYTRDTNDLPLPRN